MKKLIFIFLCSCQFISFSQVQRKEVSKENSEEPRSIADEMPQFPGGIDKMLRYLESAIRYPKEDKKKKITGVCIISLVVEKDGSITNVKVKKKIENAIACNEEAVRVVSTMPKWQPGKDDGKIIRTQVNIPVRFFLPED